MLSLLCGSLLLLLAQQCVSGAGAHAVAPGGRRPVCQWPCRCGPRAACAPGVSAVLDGCGCCKSCARQQRQACSERDVCDPHKGLYCDYSADRPRFQVGVCAYMLAVGCDLNGRHFENGHAFQPSPLYKCTCIAGAIGCTPAFTHTPAGLLGSAPPKPAGLLSGPGARKNLQDTSYRPAYRDPPLAWKRNCLVQTTPWSVCSKTCGVGMSVRVTNDNAKCEMRKDRRLCLLRPCDKNLLKSFKAPKGKTCRAQVPARRAERLVLSGCSSTQRVRPTYCGLCGGGGGGGGGGCCVPDASSMRTLEFRCKGVAGVRWKVQWITSCVCKRKCDDPGDMFTELHFL
ncbi:cellular communication network factor 6 isoform X1 [Gadus macrocephalus]|uniref:cellular communication network factor 6 isoform X1 n=1 Tax=Gadus macrocephalus TaxID=80720 RepID=UPI0028CB9A23|nr:cellular communication network factor 6 isoform X1 [Gadus macrocephalus]